MSGAALAPVAQRLAVPGGPTQPQVNLLPPEIRAGRQLTSVKAWLGVGLLATVLASGGLVVISELGLRSAENELAGTEAANAALVAEQSEYAEVPAMLARLDRLEEGRLTGMASDVLWRPYIVALAATAPAGVSIEHLSITPPVADQIVTTSDLPVVVVATITFQGRSATLPDTAAWMDALAPVRGLANPWFSAATLNQDSESGMAYYLIAGSVNVTYDGLSLRFFPVEETDVGATDETTAEPTDDAGEEG